MHLPIDPSIHATVSVAEAADLLGVSRSHMYKSVKNNPDSLPVKIIPIGGSIRIQTVSLLRALGFLAEV